MTAGLRAGIDPIYGADAHPVYQRGLNIEALPGAGIGFLAVKVQQGRDTSYLQAGSADWVRRAQAIGLPVVGYPYLMPGDEDGQAAVFAEVLTELGIAGMVDAEALKGTALAAPDGQMPDLGGLGRHPHPRGAMRTSDVRVSGAVPAPSLTMAGIRLFLDRCDYHGADVRLSYLPRWFWERMGSPSLAGLPPLWASSYPSERIGTPQDLYQAVDASRWAGYGGNQVAVLQFAETGIVAGQSPVDLDAYLGTRDQLAILLGIPQATPDKEAVLMRQIHLTNTGADAADLSGVLTIDPVGISAVMPAGSRAWLQWSGACVRNTSAKAHVWWMVERHADGSWKAIDPFDVAHGQSAARELSQGTVAVEIGLERVPPGFVFAAHLDGIGHA